MLNSDSKASPETAHGVVCSECSVTVFAMTGEETEDQCKDIAWQMFCNAHPIEAYQHDPEKFWQYFHKRVPNVSREQMVAVLKECEEPESPNDQAQRPGTDMTIDSKANPGSLQRVVVRP